MFRRPAGYRHGAIDVLSAGDEVLRSHRPVRVGTTYVMLRQVDAGMAWGVGTLVGSGAVFSVGIVGVRSGSDLMLWTVVLAIAGAGLTAGALLVQHAPGLASWLIAPPVGAVLGVANVRALFGPRGRLRM